MGDLEVATEELGTLATRLRGLSKDMKDGDGDVEYLRSELGHRTVIDAMDTFHSNWDNNRDYVCSKLDTLADLADQTASGFDETETDLARQIREAVEQ
jgi:hypothetical protein